MNDLSGGSTTLKIEVTADDILTHWYFMGKKLMPHRDGTGLAWAQSHRDLAMRRQPGTASVRAFEPTPENDGWGGGGTVIHIVVDDMPFLVDSVAAEILQFGYHVSALAHPIMVVRRNVLGELAEIIDASVTDLGDSGPGDAMVESWMHFSLDQRLNERQRRELEASIAAVLESVRVVSEDRAKMQAAIVAAAAEIETGIDGDADAARESADLLRWLADGNLLLLGHREYVAGTQTEVFKLGTGLGILRGDAVEIPIPSVADGSTTVGRTFSIARQPVRSTVYRRSYRQLIQVNTVDSQGTRRRRVFTGIFVPAAQDISLRHIPWVGSRSAAVLKRAGLTEDSHSGTRLTAILDAVPRDELFDTDIEQISDMSISVLHAQPLRRAKAFFRESGSRSFLSLLVFVEPVRDVAAIQERVLAVLCDHFDPHAIDSMSAHSEAFARVQFVVPLVDSDAVRIDFDFRAIEMGVERALLTWQEALEDDLRDRSEQPESHGDLDGWFAGIPQAYKDDFQPGDAVDDLITLNRLVFGEAAGGEERCGGRLYLARGSNQGWRFKVYRATPMSLTAALPLFRDLGLQVSDERPYCLGSLGGLSAYIYDFGLGHAIADQIGPNGGNMTAAFEAALTGRSESDALQGLVIGAGLSWQEVVIVRTYVKYLHQAGLSLSPQYVERCLLDNASVVRLLIESFALRFDPDRQGDDGAPEAAEALEKRIEGALDDIRSLDADRILRALFELFSATVRTNFYQESPDGSRAEFVALKFDAGRLSVLPEPRPLHEIWVYSPAMEGLHLRFGAVARGGLRWSERTDDFRTEILGLVKAQVVKNAVIVPTGAKGGFVVKDNGSKLTAAENGIAAYRAFITALLSLTDNYVIPGTGDARSIEHPERTVIRDADDPYLVVAADKGTAPFSDIANEIATGQGYWLGDAFASGGSHGYDHKEMGITARGAWTSVRAHFRELGTDVRTAPITVVGIGDMSGDVFGNGLLLARHARLIAAFDHRHVFLDPNPDAHRAWLERRRLFETPRSSWADFDVSLISAGGGVYARDLKSIALSRQVVEALGLPPSTKALDPPRLIHAILCAPVDLLWSGGIGTYVKASSEGKDVVGDRANDAVRADGRDLRATVVGEGGNLGFTQLGRVEAAQHGVRLNTDAIDNSAGVACSDREVNIKIFLNQLISAGELTVNARNDLLVEMTAEVARLVLRGNYRQNVLLAFERHQSAAMLPVYRRLLHSLEARGALDRDLEDLPTDTELAERAALGRGLSSPELAVLVAYAKTSLSEDLLVSGLPDDPHFLSVLTSYFPCQLTDRFGQAVKSHPLRREIVTSSLVNDVVDRGGITFVLRAVEELNATPEEVVRAFVIAGEVFKVTAFFKQIEALDDVVPGILQTHIHLEMGRLLDRATRWFLRNDAGNVDVQGQIDQYLQAVDEYSGSMERLLVGSEHVRLHDAVARWESQGVGRRLASRVSGLLDEYSLLDITTVARESDWPFGDVARLYFQLSVRYRIDDILAAISLLHRDDNWHALARAALRDDVYEALADLTRTILASSSSCCDTADEHEPIRLIEMWELSCVGRMARARATIDEVVQADSVDLASLSVALRMFQAVIRDAASGDVAEDGLQRVNG